MKRLLTLLLLLLTGCIRTPDGITAVEDFEINRYLGTWHEIARLDHSFERGLTRVTATYSLREDGGIRVLNRGYNPTSGQWKQAEGKAYLLGSPSTGAFKVSFFGPFYASYNIIALDRADYGHAMVCGPNRSYLWILARTPRLPSPVLQQLLRQAENLGFATDQLILVDQVEP
ncbi:lipocalin family protein [Trichloromonas sp.]|uniref:lipocalin family protein n=1 Tax=Trichloromonas sp. TaxID=3069249 RepID=UPI003D81B38C